MKPMYMYSRTLSLCAYVFLHILLNNKAWVDQQPFNECFKLSHFGTEVLFLMGQLIHKFGVYFDPLTIPFEFQFSTNTYNSFSSEVQVKLLYLAFTNVISTPSSNGEWISFLKSLENFPELCASVINLCFKSKRTLCPELWDFIVKEWATALQSRFENGMSDSILCVITPVCQYSEAILHLDAGSNLLEKIISTVTNFHYSLKGSCVQKCRTRLWILSRILIRCSPCLITKLPDIIGVVDFLISVCTAPYIESVTFEVNAAFNFFKEFCLLYWDSEKSLTINLITKFLDSLLTCQNSRVFSTFLLPLLQSLQKLSTKYGCLEVYCTFWTFLFKILSKAQSEFINQSVVSSCIHNEGLLETVITVLKLLSCEVYISLWTKLGIGNFISDVCLRGLILSAFIIFMVSEYHDNCTHLESKDVQKFHEWTWNSYNYLIDFDVMEITESKCICEILWNKIKYLEEESEKCSNDLWKRIVVSLKTKWDTNLGEHYLLSIQESSNQYCPNCKENIDELLDDIMISSTSNMIADCTEG
ncbi:unnamed protein product [Heterobilharzia americana]|nr:unnamed protein product [Heterobilharzia americana]